MRTESPGDPRPGVDLDVLRDAFGVSGARSLLDSADASAPELWAALRRHRLPGLLLPVTAGGLGCTMVEAVAVFEEAGRLLLAGPFVSTALLGGPLLQEAGCGAHGTALLERVASGEVALTAALGDGGAPEAGRAPFGVERDGERYLLRGEAPFVPDGHLADRIVILASGDGVGPTLFLVDPTARGVEVVQHRTMDSTRRHATVTLEDVALEEDDVVGRAGDGWAPVARVLDRALVGQAAELVGIAGRALELTVEHVNRREQFGRPVGSFQALKHRCADVLVAVELARALVEDAARALDRDGSAGLSAPAAKSCAANAAHAATTTMIQLHGGLGFTWDHDAHLFYRRALAIAAQFGGAAVHQQVVADLVITARQRHDAAIMSRGESAAVEGTRAELREWLATNPPADYDGASFEELDYHQRFGIQRAWQQKLHRAGWVGVDWPKQYGGRGASQADKVAVDEELGAIDHPGMANDVGIVVAGPAILHWGNEGQRSRYLERILSTEDIWCQGFSEREAGSDLASLGTTGVLDGDHLVINGGKVWTTVGDLADFCLLLVRTDPDVAKHRGISAVIVDMRSPGVEVRPMIQMNGDSEFSELILTDVVVPAGNVIGKLGQGWQVAMTALAYERATRTDAYKLDQLFRGLVGLVMSVEEQRGGPDRALRQSLGRLGIEARAARAWEQHITRRRLGNEEIGLESSIGKLAGSEIAQRMSAFALEVLGPAGLCTSGDAHSVGGGAWARLALTSRYYTIASGSSEIQRNILSERVLAMPRG